MNFSGVHYFDSLASTNELSLEWIAKTRPAEGTAIIAGHQTGGRGQFGSIWESEADKNVLMSVILYPDFLEPSRLFLLQMLCSVTLLEIVKSKLPDIPFCLKWPNDLLVKDRKLAGILLQTGIRGNKLDYAVLGIGLNLNQEHFPAHLPMATSMHNLGFKGHAPSAFALEIREALLTSYDTLKKTDSMSHVMDYWHKKYESCLCWLKQLRRILPTHQDPYVGSILGVTEQGQLHVSDGQSKTFYYWPREIKTEPLNENSKP